MCEGEVKFISTQGGKKKKKEIFFYGAKKLAYILHMNQSERVSSKVTISGYFLRFADR